eukprot:3333681-Rhodomonas_salina.1
MLCGTDVAYAAMPCSYAISSTGLRSGAMDSGTDTVPQERGTDLRIVVLTYAMVLCPYSKKLCARKKDNGSYALDPMPYTLGPTPYALHPTPYTLHPTP